MKTGRIKVVNKPTTNKKFNATKKRIFKTTMTVK